MGKKIFAAVLALMFLLTSFPVFGADSPAYNELAAQQPVYEMELTLSELEEYYMTTDTDKLLDPAECNYLYGEVSVGGVAELCHVYMRTFIITDVSELTVFDLEALAKRIVGFVKTSASMKYLKCIARTYNARISGMVQTSDGRTDSITVKIFISCGEKTEDRLALKEGYIAGIAEELLPLSDGERFLRLNGLMLDGRFRYDMSYRHRCSSVALVSEGIGVCEEYAGFTSLVLDALGYKNRLITGEVGGMPHIWNLVEVDGRVYHLDILHNGPVDENGVHLSAERTFLLVSEATVMKTHDVAEACVPYSSECRYDYVFDGYPLSMPGVSEINGVEYVSAEPDTTVAALREDLGAGEFLRVLRGDTELLPEDVVSTGCTAEITVNGRIIDSAVICVQGDLDCDGSMTSADLEALVAYLLADDVSQYDETFLAAADIDQNGAVSVTDFIIIADVTYVPTPPDEPGDETTGEETEEPGTGTGLEDGGAGE